MGVTLILMTWNRVHETIIPSVNNEEIIKVGLLLGYPEFGKHLNETGRPIVYSCSWPAYWGDRLPNYPLIQKTCNLWRNYGDIQDTFGDVLDIVDHYGDHEDDFAQFAGPGNWNDPDMVWNLIPDRQNHCVRIRNCANQLCCASYIPCSHPLS